MSHLRFPRETDAYRQARDELLEAELALRQQVETVAQLRRQLPLGGEVTKDYIFEEGPRDLADGDEPSRVALAELVEPNHDTLVLYSFMYGPNMDKACPMCSSFIDGLQGNARHITQRVALAIVAKSPLARLRAFARERGWNNLRLLSSAGTDYNRDYHGEDGNAGQIPMLSVFAQRDGSIYHWWSSELQAVPAEAGQNQRHLDAMWPLWNVLDVTPKGRGDWYPPL